MKKIEYLPAELTEQILRKLPVKTLLRFKCVCKNWHSLITSQAFIGRHYSDDSNQLCQIIRFYNSRSYHPFCHSIHEASKHPRIEEANLLPQLPTGNDVFSLMGAENGVFFTISTGELVLLNPAMRETRKLPLPVKSYDVIGLGFEALAGNHKVVVFDQEGVSPKIRASIYNWRNNSWKSVEINPSRSWVADYHGSSKSSNGVCYLFACHYFYREEKTFFITFDMRSERFAEMEVPEGLEYNESSVVEIVGHGDSIGVYHCNSSMIDDEFWVLEKEGFWRRADPDFRFPPLNWWRRKMKYQDNGNWHVNRVFSYKESLFSIK